MNTYSPDIQDYDQEYFAPQVSKSDAKVAWQYGRIFAMAKVKPTGRILDLGCGAGPGLRYVSSQGADVVGLDLIHFPLVEAQHAAPNADVVQANVEKPLPFSNKSFDIILMSEVIEHIKHGRPLLSECMRVLRIGGHIIITTPNLWDIRRLIAKARGEAWSGDTDPTHVNLYDPIRLADELFSVGFERVRWKTGLKPAWTLSSRKLKMRLHVPYPPVIGNGIVAAGQRAK
jgi:SAM-dependent methyltransferase